MDEEENLSPVSNFAKYALFFFNFIFWTIGVVLIAIGSWALAKKNVEHLKVVTSGWDFLFDVTVALIIIGIVIVVLSTLGCVGALRENICLLRTFWVSLVSIVICLLVIGIVGLTTINSLIESKLGDVLINEYFEDPDQKDLIDFVQEQFQCCGISDEGYRDWNKNEYFSCEEGNVDPRKCSVPHSCCRIKNAAALNVIYTVGCSKSVSNSIYSNILTLCIVVLIFTIVPTIEIFFATTLIQQIKDQKSKWNRRATRPPYAIYNL